jgi:hypothetical protein
VQHTSSATLVSASYNGDGIRVKKTDTRGALGLQVHDYSYSPFGLMHESNPNTVYTPGFGHRSNGINSFYHTDWLGSTRYTSTDGGTSFPQGLRFDAFGNRSAASGTDPVHPTDFQFGGGAGYQTETVYSDQPGLALQYLEQRLCALHGCSPLIRRRTAPSAAPRGLPQAARHPLAARRAGQEGTIPPYTGR